MKVIRNIRWHTVLIDTLKTETSKFVLNPSLHWKRMKIKVYRAIVLTTLLYGCESWTVL